MWVNIPAVCIQSISLDCIDWVPTLPYVQGGEDTIKEMCLAFLLYYPRQKMLGCSSMLTFEEAGDNSVYSILGLSSPEWVCFTHSLHQPFIIANHVEAWCAKYISLLAFQLLCCYSGGGREGAYIHMSNSREFGCSRVRQFEALNRKLYEKVSLTPQLTATNYQ